MFLYLIWSWFTHNYVSTFHYIIILMCLDFCGFIMCPVHIYGLATSGGGEGRELYRYLLSKWLTHAWELESLLIYAFLIICHIVSRLSSATDVNPLDLTSFACLDCPRIFKSQYLLDNHIKRFHPAGGKFICIHCNKTFISRNKYTYHMKIHGTVKHACPECKKEFSKKSHLTNHVLIHTNERPFECDICHVKMKTKDYLRVHKKRVHGDMKKSHICDICDFAAVDKWGLKSHYRIHMKDFQYHCTICTKAFARKDYLDNHFKIHLGEKPFRWLLCDSSFTRKDYLNNHLKIHTGEKPYQCSVCEKMFARKDYLENHSRIHTGERPFHCDLCSRSFARKDYLDNHLKTHTGERPYQCSECEKSFARKDYLDNHYKLHVGVEPYVCIICNIAFTNREYLLLHSKQHEGAYNCGVCSCSFNTRELLENHFKEHAES